MDPSEVDAYLAEKQQVDPAEIDRYLHEKSNNRDYSWEGKAARGIKGIGSKIGEGLRNVSRGIESVTAAPVRAAVGAMLHGGNAQDAASQQFMKDPAIAPTGDQLLEGIGVPSGPKINTGLNLSPTGDTLKITPRGVAGGMIESGLDPSTYIPGFGAERTMAKGLEGAAELSPKIAEYFAHQAEERAVKAGTGSNLRAVRKIAKVNPQSAGDAQRIIDELRASGRKMLETDEAGAPVVGWFNNSKNIADKAAAKKNYFGNKIGEVGQVVDTVTPNSISGTNMGTNVNQYKESIPNVGVGKKIRPRLEEEAQGLSELGNVPFSYGQDIKQQYPFKPTSPDAFESSQDATNTMRKLVGEEQDTAVKNAMQSKDATPDQRKILESYGPAKEGYGVNKDISEAGADRVTKDLSNRFISPSSYGFGSAVGIGKAAAKEGLPELWGAVAGAAHQVVLERGSSTVAKVLDGLSKAIARAPAAFEKYDKVLRSAAALGPTFLAVKHHELMNNDPEYAAQIQGGQP